MSEIENIRHSLAHLLAMAVKEKYPNAKLGLGPTIENGFYYDFDFGAESLTEADLDELEKKIRSLVSQNLEFTAETITAAEARKIFAHEPYKLELIDELEKDNQPISLYRSGNFVDLCAGPHIANSSNIPRDAFRLDRLAGAYWRGDENNKMLTRVYGLAFANKPELNDFLEKREEAEKRDHRRLGKELDLYHIDEEVGLGLPLWHPKGAILWRIIEDFWYVEHLKNGYELVRTPHIGSKKLWETSGHWDFYNSSMYPPMEVGQSLEEKQKAKKMSRSEEYLIKPMNCPFHIKIYKNSPHSYKNLPLRWAECGTVYRFEKRGELSGLTRVRGFTQDDAHIICREDQVAEELKKVVDFILFIYKSFGFEIESVKVFLSLRDPENKDKYAGSDQGWKFTENILRQVATEKGLNFVEERGEAAFYGPKLDFKIKDSLGRLWQCSTLQFDFNLPERFDLTFKNNQGNDERPYVLHRALLGSFERFIGLLIEHYAGAFPLWLSPVQVKILPISEKQINYANEVLADLKTRGLRAQLDESNETLGKKIRQAKLEKIPYLLVVGEKESKNKTVTVEARDTNDSHNLKLSEFCIKAEEKLKSRK